MRCMETNQEPQEVEIVNHPKGLLVIDPDIGTSPLDHYHHNLTDISWEERAAI